MLVRARDEGISGGTKPHKAAKQEKREQKKGYVGGVQHQKREEKRWNAEAEQQEIIISLFPTP